MYDPVQGLAEVRIDLGGSDYLFVNIPVGDSGAWMSRTEITKKHYQSVVNSPVAVDSENFPVAANWYDAARFCNKLTSMLADSLFAKNFSAAHTVFKPAYTDTLTSFIMSPESIAVAGFCAAFASIPTDSFRNSGASVIRIKAADSLTLLSAIIDSFSMSIIDTSRIRAMVLLQPDSVKISGALTFWSINNSITGIYGPLSIDTNFLDTLIKAANSMRDTPIVFTAYRRYLATTEGVPLSSNLSQGTFLPGDTVLANSRWYFAYFATTPRKTFLDSMHSVLLPAPCTLSIRQPETTVSIWYRDNSAYAFRLPTIGEWESAAQGGTYHLQYSTNTGKLRDDAVVYASSAAKEVFGNNLRAENPYGLTDMTGNLYEWVEDWWDGTDGVSGLPVLPFKGLKGGYFGNTAADSALISVFTVPANPYSSYESTTGIRPIIRGGRLIDSLFNSLRK